MATRKGGSTRVPAKRGASLAAAASAMAAAAAAEADDGRGEDDDERPRTASGRVLEDAAGAVITEAQGRSTKEPRATVKRLNEDDGKFATLDTVDASLVSEEWVQRTYGGGKYRVLIHGPVKGGGWGYVGMESYEIDKSVPFRGSIMGRDQRATIHNPDGSVVGGPRLDADLNALMKTQIVELVQSSADVRARDRESSSAVMTMMMTMMKESSERNDRFMQLMMTMMNQKPTGPSLTELLAAITPLVMPLLGSRKDPLEMATQLMALTGGAAKGGASSISEVVAAIKELRETADLFNPGEREEDTSLLGTITRLAPQLLTLLTEQQRAALQAQPAPTPAPVAAATYQPAPSALPPAAMPQPAPVGAIEGEQDMGMVTAMLQPYAGMLVEHAMADDDPFDLGHSVAVLIPFGMRNAVAAFIERDTAAAEVIAAIPALSPYPAWVGEFIDGVRERYNPLADDDDGGEEKPSPEAASPGEHTDD